MSVIKVLIVDDEQSARNIMTNLVKLSFPEFEIIEPAENIPTAVSKIKSYQPDIVFLDVEMPKYTGYEIIKFFDRIDFQIIFATAYDQFAIQAFEANAVDYLLKPIERSRLNDAVKKALNRIALKKQLADYKKLLDDIEAEESPTFHISEAGQRKIIKQKDIIAIKAQGAYSEVYFENELMVISKNIGSIGKELEDNPNIIRTHKSWLINSKAVVSYKKGAGEIVLTNGTIAKISRFKKEEFDKLFSSL